MKHELKWEYDGNEKKWKAASAIMATFDDPFHYIIEVDENGCLKTSEIKLETGVVVVDPSRATAFSTLSHAKDYCQEAENRAIESARSGVSPPSLESDARAEKPRDLLGKINSAIADEECELVPNKDAHGLFEFRRKTAHKPTPKPPNYGEMAIELWRQKNPGVILMHPYTAKEISGYANAIFMEDVLKIVDGYFHTSDTHIGNAIRALTAKEK